MDNIAFSLTRVSKALSRKPVYRAVVQTNAVFGHEELSKRLAERTKQDAKYWKYILDVLSNEIETQLLAGNRVNLGRFAISLAIRGAFSSEDDVFRASDYTINSTPDTGEAPYVIDFVPYLPAVAVNS